VTTPANIYRVLVFCLQRIKCPSPQ